MKLKNTIAIIAIAAGILSAGTVAQAGDVYFGYLFTPVTIKMTGNYVDNRGKHHKYTVANKDIVAYLGYPSGTKLEYFDGDVYAINDKYNIFDDLTYYGYVYVYYDAYVSNSYYKSNGTYVYDESGVVYLRFYSDANPSLLAYNDLAFEVSGSYTDNVTVSAPNPTTGAVKRTMKFSSSDLSGTASDHYYVNAYPYLEPFTGSFSGNGSGTVY